MKMNLNISLFPPVTRLAQVLALSPSLLFSLPSFSHIERAVAYCASRLPLSLNAAEAPTRGMQYKGIRTPQEQRQAALRPKESPGA